MRLRQSSTPGKRLPSGNRSHKEFELDESERSIWVMTLPVSGAGVTLPAIWREQAYLSRSPVSLAFGAVGARGRAPAPINLSGFGRFVYPPQALGASVRAFRLSRLVHFRSPLSPLPPTALASSPERHGRVGRPEAQSVLRVPVGIHATAPGFATSGSGRCASVRSRSISSARRSIIRRPSTL